MTETSSHPLLSVVVPVRNEVGNIAPLVADIEKACTAIGPFEVVYVNDGSTDGTAAALAELAATRPWLRVVTHAQSCGQSAAVRSGVRHARSAIVATLDGDGQNDPAFLPQMVEILQKGGLHAGLVQGQRVGSRTGIKCVGNTVVVHGVPYAPPYIITAIGDHARLEQGLRDSDYLRVYRQYVDAYRLGYDVTRQARTEMPAYTGPATFVKAVAQR